MDFTLRNYIIIGLLVSNLILFTSVEGNSIEISEQRQLKINQGEFEFDIGNITQDTLQAIAELIYKGDGTGITEIIWNLLPIVGNNSATNALLYPIFLILFTGGVYQMLKRQGVID